ncbi:uncharacterized protein LOC114745603 isoform X2 [Neltuma alba]|uniref:uncharacterized protein LOC114745603 isoform X2 n=2 Tax=Neltuma alba TaxID=207710 RepID=UPI0010A2C3BF|nr:uncharacterized protein LOC114745603 isoform X2 [Prosopis alba]
MAGNAIDGITDYSKTERLILLIDLNPLLHLEDPTPYINSLLTSTKILLTFPPLSSSLFCFKLFFSSLSPLLSSSKLHHFVPNHSLSLSFSDSTFTLQSLSQTLTSLPHFHNPLDPSPPRASHLAASVQQIVHDYAWDSVICSPIPDAVLNYPVVRSNLVVLFSPICRSFKCLSEFFDVELGHESLKNVGPFCERFSGFFRSVSGAFGCRDIHFSWVDVKCESGCYEHKNETDEIKLVYSFFESGTRALGWGLCSVDSVILGSALLPFGLIYPKIGVSSYSLDINDYSSKLHVQLSLQILDVSRNPIEYNCCDLELIKFRFFGKYDDVRFDPELINPPKGGREHKEKFWKQFGNGITKFHIKAVQRNDAFLKLGDRISDSFLVREVFGESKKQRKGISNEFFADRVLDILAVEFGFMWQRNSEPIWQMLCSFLYNEGCWALVYLSNSDGGSFTGILRPFTISSALLSLIDDPDMVLHFGGENMAQHIRTLSADVCKPDINFKKRNKLLDSQDKKSGAVIEGHQKKNIMDRKSLQKLTWSTFWKAAYDQVDIDLHGVYHARECKKSKKLKFLKCWMKQMKKPDCHDIIVSDTSKPNQLIPENIDTRLTGSPQDGQLPISSSASAGENTLTEASGVQAGAVLDTGSETSEGFFSTLSDKIHQGIASEDVDLQALAERLVNSSIYWLSKKFDRETISESQNSSKCNDAYDSMIAAELSKILLMEPKELVTKHKSKNPFSQASETGTSSPIAGQIVREYELQILFRMEILQSDVGSGVEESGKQKMVKQICLLLENIQCHMEGGFFGDWNLDNYVARIIKSRYSHSVGDVVHEIYDKMDLLLFAEEDETPNHFLISEDSNKSWNGKADRDEMGENNVSSSGPISSENEPFQLLKNANGSLERNKQQEDPKIVEAKKKRERARRFSSFTSCIPDLQKLWAPKQMSMKLKSDSFRKLPTRKKKKRERASYDTVCETPLTGNKRSCSWTSKVDDDHYRVDGSQRSNSVSKALFQDDQLM